MLSGAFGGAPRFLLVPRRRSRVGPRARATAGALAESGSPSAEPRAHSGREAGLSVEGTSANRSRRVLKHGQLAGNGFGDERQPLPLAVDAGQRLFGPIAHPQLPRSGCLRDFSLQHDIHLILVDAGLAFRVAAVHVILQLFRPLSCRVVEGVRLGFHWRHGRGWKQAWMWHGLLLLEW